MTSPDDQITDNPEVGFSPVAFAGLPGWGEDDHLEAFRSFLKSCERTEALKSTIPPTNSVPGPPAPDRNIFLAPAKAARTLGRGATNDQARAYFEHNFTPYRVNHCQSSGLLTGYYEPELEGSRSRTEKFHVPVRARPRDLVNLVDDAARGTNGKKLTHAKKTGTDFEQYATRAQIDGGVLDGQGLELLYLADPVDKFFMQIQGSGRILLTDGTAIRLTYDGKNGLPYTSIGRYLIDENLMRADDMTLDALGTWLRANRDRARPVMWQNESYVFFRELVGQQADGPLGVDDITLSPGRSLAVDTSYHALGTPIYVDAPNLSHAASGRSGFQRLMIAQDVGSAITGPERGDIFFGTGSNAGQIAGATKHKACFYTLLPRDHRPPNRRLEGTT